MKYTTGNWSVASLTTDSIATPKTISLTDLALNADFSKTLDEPSEARIGNITAGTVTSPEYIRYANSSVKDIYATSATDPSLIAPQRSGVQVMTEIHSTFRATNSVTGQEIDLPWTGRLVLRIPAYAAVTTTAVDYALKRTIAAALNTGSTDASRIMEMARGSLLPE